MVDIVVLVKDRIEFTEIMLRELAQHTDWSLIRKLLLVDDQCKPETRQLLETFVRDRGLGEIVPVTAGSVTNALFLGTERLLADPPTHFVKLDNDFLVCPKWLEIASHLAERSHHAFDVIGFSMTGEFFDSAPELVHTYRPFDDYELEPTAYTGGNFLMKWDTYARIRNLGVSEKPANYITGSISETHRALSIRGALKTCVIKPHLPVFKLDRALDVRFEDFDFFERRGIDRSEVARWVTRYDVRGESRKHVSSGHVLNRF